MEEIDSLFDIRPVHSRPFAQFGDDWYISCGKAFLACVDYLRICDLLFTPIQVAKLEAFCKKHSIELGAAIVQIVQLGLSRQFDPPMFQERMFEALFPTPETRQQIDAYCKANNINSRHRLIVSAMRLGLKEQGVL